MISLFNSLLNKESRVPRVPKWAIARVPECPSALRMSKCPHTFRVPECLDCLGCPSTLLEPLECPSSAQVPF